MSEQEKMLSGQLYNSSLEDLPEKRKRCHDLCREYNTLSETDEKRNKIIKELIPEIGSNFYFQGPIQFDYGEFTSIGDNFYANFNFTVLDVCPVKIGNNVFCGPDVRILTSLHPLRYQERNPFEKDGKLCLLEYGAPITIGDNCWFGGGVTVCAGVTIGSGCVIGAGSVVTKDIPDNSLAAGVPCRVIRTITEEDSLYKDKSI